MTLSRSFWQQEKDVQEVVPKDSLFTLQSLMKCRYLLKLELKCVQLLGLVVRTSSKEKQRKLNNALKIFLMILTHLSGW